ncbi:hypothetical protein [Embleya sp. NBC_00896]|uniref:hypothetical protein n=1 Tax=Embleya sp. NBC_00896 TaxID=2975961 RepID=UPI0038639D59|nr:hypothetical protein OG928_21925 [Embleya sp. NBC_00896]
MAGTRERGPGATDRAAGEAVGGATDPMAITEGERTVPDRPIDPPFALVYDVVRRTAREREAGREEMRKRLESTHERYTGLAADAAVALHELRGCLEGEAAPAVLASIARRFATALDRAGVRFDDPVGEAYAAVGRRVDVAHAPDSGDEGTMIVAKTLRPGVLLDDGEVIRRAQVVLGFVPTPAQREGAASARAVEEPVVSADPVVSAEPGPGEAAAEATEVAADAEPEKPKPSRPRARRGKPRKAARETKPVAKSTRNGEPKPAAGNGRTADPEPRNDTEPRNDAKSPKSPKSPKPSSGPKSPNDPHSPNTANHEGGTAE